jgi:mRNA interferase MazF
LALAGGGGSLGGFVKGDVVVLHFPFSDLTQTKRRPALVLATLSGDDIILCQITSQTKFDAYAIALSASDFDSGGLSQPSRIRPNRLFTADSGIVIYAAGRVRDVKLREVLDALIAILRQQ